jgi:putative transposase
MEKDTTKGLSKVIRIDESEIRGHLDKMVKGTVEDTINALLEAEADEMCNALRYERSPERVDTRAGHYKRKLHTKAGEVEIKVPKLRKQTFETAIIERYRRRDISIEEAIVQMYLAGVSVRRVEDITEALWGTVNTEVIFPISAKVKFPTPGYLLITYSSPCVADFRGLPRRFADALRSCCEMPLSDSGTRSACSRRR